MTPLCHIQCNSAWHIGDVLGTYRWIRPTPNLGGDVRRVPQAEVSQCTARSGKQVWNQSTIGRNSSSTRHKRVIHLKHILMQPPMTVCTQDNALVDLCDKPRFTGGQLVADGETSCPSGDETPAHGQCSRLADMDKTDSDSRSAGARHGQVSFCVLSLGEHAWPFLVVAGFVLYLSVVAFHDRDQNQTQLPQRKAPGMLAESTQKETCRCRVPALRLSNPSCRVGQPLTSPVSWSFIT